MQYLGSLARESRILSEANLRKKFTSMKDLYVAETIAATVQPDLTLVLHKPPNEELVMPRQRRTLLMFTPGENAMIMRRVTTCLEAGGFVYWSARAERCGESEIFRRKSGREAEQPAAERLAPHGSAPEALSSDQPPPNTPTPPQPVPKPAAGSQSEQIQSEQHEVEPRLDLSRAAPSDSEQSQPYQQLVEQSLTAHKQSREIMSRANQTSRIWNKSSICHNWARKILSAAKYTSSRRNGDLITCKQFRTSLIRCNYAAAKGTATGAEAKGEHLVDSQVNVFIKT
ncbi:hypothetical protein LTR97_004852 [Elasticomyces elasticus]|uniref:Uncharacterized protein n=1 Tax=Elasticomyces elasticus TaxID=574655 RepID=A0AAN7WDX5_9PEZI|nr:hypothetical protein LTR97_004852 [Elasticomyces elasticus]